VDVDIAPEEPWRCALGMDGLFALGFGFPQLTTLRLATLAFVFSFCIQVSKLFHAPWFDAVRATKIRRLIFGYVFGWRNIFCYFIGIVLGAIVDAAFRAKRLRYSKQTE
jgi:hypothetical protein